MLNVAVKFPCKASSRLAAIKCWRSVWPATGRHYWHLDDADDNDDRDGGGSDGTSCSVFVAWLVNCDASDHFYDRKAQRTYSLLPPCHRHLFQIKADEQYPFKHTREHTFATDVQSIWTGLNCSARGGGPLIILYLKPVKIFWLEVYRVAQKSKPLSRIIIKSY